jgi:hypothetical protein
MLETSNITFSSDEIVNLKPFNLTNGLLIFSLDDDDDDDDDDEHLVEKVRVKASNILLSCCAERSAEKFPPNVLTVGLIHPMILICIVDSTLKKIFD